MSIYGQYETDLTTILADVEQKIKQLNQAVVANHQPKLYEHLIGRVKEPASMADKCWRKHYPVTTVAALRQCHDAVGVRLVCNFISDISRCRTELARAQWLPELPPHSRRGRTV